MGGGPSKEENPFGKDGWTPERIGSLEGKTYVITGTTTGCGFEATRLLLTKGASVVMLNRSGERSQGVMDKCKAEFGSDAKVSFVLADLADLTSVRNAAASVLQQASRIDALICNAAIAQVAVQKLTVDGFESQLAENHYSHFLLCGLLFSRIAESSGRVVVVGSNGYKMGPKEVINFDDMNFDNKYTDWNAYCHSKLAQHIFAYALQRRVKAAGKDVVVQMCHPGASRTNLIEYDISMFNSVLIKVISPFFQSAELGAWPEVMCATEGNLKEAAYYGPTTCFDTLGPVGECKVEPLALDEDVASRLWVLSEEKVGLKWSP